MNKRCFAAAVVALLIHSAVPSLHGQAPAKPTPGDVMIEKYLAGRTDELSKRELDGATTLAEWEQRRPRLRREYFDMLGLWPLPEKTPLQATVTGTLEHEGVLIAKLHFQSRPGLYVTGNVYRPKEPRGRLPAILYVCGHSDRGRDGNKSAYQDHGMWFASNGYLCLVLDTLMLGEIRGIHHGTYKYGRWWWQAAGYTPAGVECWNGVRAIDYLVSRPDVDPERIGVTGISGGGAATFWIAAADERVRCAVPVSGMSDLESYVKHKVINGHCDCMFLINAYGWEWTTIAALIAPRPLLFANSDNDRIFPMDGNRRIIARLRKLYALYGKPDLVDEYVSHGDHAYRPALRVAAFKWLNKYVKNDTKTPVKDADFKPIPARELRVFPEDKDIPADQINTKIDETFVPTAKRNVPEKKHFAAWKEALLKKLQEKSLRSLFRPARAVTGEWVADEAIDVRTRSILVPKNALASNTLIILNAGEEKSPGAAWVNLQAENSVDAFAPRGVGTAARTVKSPPNYVQRAHALVGTTVDEGRLRDIISVVRANTNWELECGRPAIHSVKLVGKGQAGILAAYAALFEPVIKEVVIIDPPRSHKEGPIFLNVLRVLDIPEALGLLAPTRLTLINARDPAFDRTAELYRLAGAADKLTRK